LQQATIFLAASISTAQTMQLSDQTLHFFKEKMMQRRDDVLHFKRFNRIKPDNKRHRETLQEGK